MFARYANSNSGWRVVYAGGNYNDEDNDGLFYFNANNAATNHNDNIGARLLIYLQLICTDFSTPQGENITVRARLSRFILERL